MIKYGNKIKYDISTMPIKMSLPSDASKILELWTENYRLPIKSKKIDSSDSSRILYIFDASVDSDTFIRHLKTALPNHYDNL